MGLYEMLEARVDKDMVDSPIHLVVVRMSDLGSTRMLRDSIDALFNRLEARAPGTVTLDFTGVKFSSWSAAHEYLVRRTALQCTISELGIGSEVARMIELVKVQMERSKNGVARPMTAWTTSPVKTI